MPQKYRSAIHLIFIDPQGRLLLSLRCNTGYMDGWYSLVAGHLEPGETVAMAGVREALEEVGVTLRPEDIEVVGVMHRKSGEERIDFFAHVHAWEGEPFNAEPEKCDELIWRRPDELPDNLVPYIRRGLQNFYDKTRFDTFGWDEIDA